MTPARRGGRALQLARPAAIFLASRLVVLAALAVGTTVRSGLDPSQKLTLATQLQRWDVQWYLKAAAHGYPHTIPTVGGHAAESTIAFFPLFPLLVRAAAAATGATQFIAGLVLANLFGLVACILLWAITTRIAGSGSGPGSGTGTEAADRSVALFAFFPGAFVLSLPYSEPLMLVLAMACLLCILDRRWPLAGVFAALATATRPNAIVLVACFAVEALVLLRARHPDRGRAIVGTLVAPLGAVAFFAFLAVRTHALAAWFHVQKGGWNESLSLTANVRRIEFVVHHRVQDANIFVTVLGLAVLVVALVYLFLDRPPRPLVVYTLGIVALALFSKTLGPRPRFVLTAFPLFIALGRRLRPLAWSLTMAVSAGLLGALTILSLAANRVTP